MKTRAGFAGEELWDAQSRTELAHPKRPRMAPLRPETPLFPSNEQLQVILGDKKKKKSIKEKIYQRKKPRRLPAGSRKTSRPIAGAAVIVPNLSIKLSCSFIDCKHQFLSWGIIS